MKQTTAILLLTIFLTISAFGQTILKTGSSAPAFSGTSLKGDSLDLDNLKGSVVVVTFWSTRCAICHHEIPKLNRFVDQYDPNKVVFLALSMENEEKISGYLAKNPFRFQILSDSFGVVLKYADRDKTGSLDMGFPSYFVIDQDGLIRHRSSGYDKTPSIAAAINKLVSK